MGIQPIDLPDWSLPTISARRGRRARVTTLLTCAIWACAISCTAISCLKPTDLLRDQAPINPDRTIHVVIENPSGTDEKWEVRADGRLVQEGSRNDRVLIPYLPWPANAGMVPRTLLSAELGGDGEPLDVLVLGPAIPRGRTVRAMPIGLLRVVDRLERDDKILAVLPNASFADVEDVEDLDRLYPGVREILSTWYRESRPGGSIEVQGFGSRAAANLLISESVRAFDEAERSGTMPDWQSP